MYSRTFVPSHPRTSETSINYQLKKRLYVEKTLCRKYELCAPRTSFPFFHPPGLIIYCPLSIINYRTLSIKKKREQLCQSRSHCYKRWREIRGSDWSCSSHQRVEQDQPQPLSNETKEYLFPPYIIIIKEWPPGHSLLFVLKNTPPTSPGGKLATLFFTNKSVVTVVLPVVQIQNGRSFLVVWLSDWAVTWRDFPIRH